MKFWYRQSLWPYLLSPLSVCYRLGVAIKLGLYSFNIKKSFQAPVPVIVVGNLTVGGTGKTPLVIAIANYLKQQGFNPGIVSRGYKAKSQDWPRTVMATDSAVDVGDEPLLIVKQTGCPMVIDPKRVRALQALLAKNVDVIISDDGFQHYAMGRDIEIIVVDGDRKFGNEFFLPSGPLRDSIKLLDKVNFVVCNGEKWPGGFQMALQPGPVYQITNPDNQLTNTKQTVHAVTGIGNPDRFFNGLRQLGFNVIEHPFPDHYLFKPGDINFSSDSLVIMTEKDAVKCQEFADDNHYCLPVKANLNKQFYLKLTQEVFKNVQR